MRRSDKEGPKDDLTSTTTGGTKAKSTPPPEPAKPKYTSE